MKRTHTTGSFWVLNKKIIYVTHIAQCLTDSECSGTGAFFLLLIMSRTMTRSLVGTCFCRWNEVTRRIEMWISILELNELGEYAAVELHQAKDVNTGGVFQLRQVLGLSLLVSCFLPVPLLQFLEFSSYLPLCSLILSPSLILFPHPSLPIPIPGPHFRITPPPLQGHSRRVQVTVKPVQRSGTLPLMVEAILSISIGCVTARSTKLQRGLDSYQVRPTDCKQYLTKIG